MMYLLTPEVHAQVVSSYQLLCRMANIDHALNPTLEMLNAMKPVEVSTHQFQTADGGWHPFSDDKHYQNTKEDGRWPIRELYAKEQQ